MDIEVVQSGQVAVVVPKGDLDTGAADPMKQKLADLLDHGKTRLIVDLESVGYIDSRGLGELVGAMKRARRAGGDLCLCAPRGEVLQVLEMTHLHEGMAIYDTRGEAMAAWN